MTAYASLSRVDNFFCPGAIGLAQRGTRSHSNNSAGPRQKRDRAQRKRSASTEVMNRVKRELYNKCCNLFHYSEDNALLCCCYLQ